MFFVLYDVLLEPLNSLLASIFKLLEFVLSVIQFFYLDEDYLFGLASLGFDPLFKLPAFLLQLNDHVLQVLLGVITFLILFYPLKQFGYLLLFLYDLGISGLLDFYELFL